MEESIKGWAECPECGLDIDDIKNDGRVFCPYCRHWFSAYQKEREEQYREGHKPPS